MLKKTQKDSNSNTLPHWSFQRVWTKKIIFCKKAPASHCSTLQNLEWSKDSRHLDNKMPPHDLESMHISKIKILLPYRYTCIFDPTVTLFLTWNDPLMADSRFLQTGRSMSIQFRLRQAALARAQGRAGYKGHNS